MTEETKAGLKLLAEYMGEKPHVNEYPKETQHLFYKPYNTSWDALVPVFSKAIHENYVMELAFTVFGALKENNPQAAFEAVVEIVELINKEKE